MKKQLNVKISADVIDRATEKLGETGMSMASLVETLLSLYAEGQISVSQKIVVNIAGNIINTEEKEG